MKTNLVIGDPVSHSLSPQIHQEAYRQLGISEEYQFIAKRVSENDLQEFIASETRNEASGLAVTMPHKLAIMDMLDEVEHDAREVGAVNTVVNEEGRLIGHNTDWQGVAYLLRAYLSPSTKLAILGTGGTTRAAAYAGAQAGAQMTIFGRNHQKAVELAEDFGALPADINAKSEIANHDIIINTTPIGLTPENEVDLLSLELLSGNHLVFDAIYGRETKLMKLAQEAGAQVVTGLDLLIAQAVPQCELHTGKRPDYNQLRKFAEDNL